MIPSHAITIWLENNAIHMAFPGAHTTCTPLTDKGWRIVQEILQQRATASASEMTIGTLAAPTTDRLTKGYLRDIEKERAAAERAMQRRLREMDKKKAAEEAARERLIIRPTLTLEDLLGEDYPKGQQGA
jgi:hypothetical protein